MEWYWFVLAENGLSFIETSALDATNVELSFQKILTGMLGEKKKKDHDVFYSHTHHRNLSYRIKQGSWIFQQCHQTYRWSNNLGVTNTRWAKARWLLLNRLGLAWQLRINFTCVYLLCIYIIHKHFFPLPLCLCSNLQDIKGFYHKLRWQHIGVKLISLKDAWSWEQAWLMDRCNNKKTLISGTSLTWNQCVTRWKAKCSCMDLLDTLSIQCIGTTAQCFIDHQQDIMTLITCITVNRNM